MNISLQYSHITVNDIDEAIKFYRDGLGLEVKSNVESGDHRWVTLGSDTQPGLEIVLSDPHAGRSPADGGHDPGIAGQGRDAHDGFRYR